MTALELGSYNDAEYTYASYPSDPADHRVLASSGGTIYADRFETRSQRSVPDAALSVGLSVGVGVYSCG